LKYHRTRKRADFWRVALTREFVEPTKTRKQMATEVVKSVDASVLINGEWHAINWQAVSENVRRLQARIVKATKEGRWLIARNSPCRNRVR
jgi:hypothetical protein